MNIWYWSAALYLVLATISTVSGVSAEGAIGGPDRTCTRWLMSQKIEQLILLSQWAQELVNKVRGVSGESELHHSPIKNLFTVRRKWIGD